MITRRQSLLLLSGGLATSTLGQGTEEATGDTGHLQLQIPPSVSNEDQMRLTLSQMYFVITNDTKERQGIWQDSCSWGWQAPEVQITVQGTTFSFQKPLKQWKRNFPDPYYIDPHSHYVLPINLLGPEWTEVKDLERLSGVSALITATFTIHPSKEAVRLKIWTGRLKAEIRAFVDIPSHPK